eukprot:1160780-Pelagomonas_calceolata.AAC.8
MKPRERALCDAHGDTLRVAHTETHKQISSLWQQHASRGGLKGEGFSEEGLVRKVLTVTPKDMHDTRHAQGKKLPQHITHICSSGHEMSGWRDGYDVLSISGRHDKQRKAPGGNEACKTKG